MGAPRCRPASGSGRSGFWRRRRSWGRLRCGAGAYRSARSSFSSPQSPSRPRSRSGRRDIGRRRSRLSCSWPWPGWAGRGSRFGARSGVAPLRMGNPCRRCPRCPLFRRCRRPLVREREVVAAPDVRSGACSPAPKFGGVFDPVSCMLVCLFGERGLRCLGRSRPARLVIGSDAAACGFCPFRVGVSIGPREFGCFCPHGAYTLVVYDRCFLAVR